MVVNSVVKLPVKIIKGGQKVIGKNGLHINAPENATSYELLRGTGKKGAFEQYIFRTDGQKQPVQIYTRYENDGKIKDVVTDFSISDNLFNYDRTILSDGVKETQHVSILGQQLPSGGIVFTKAFLNMASNGDRAGMEVLRHGKKPAGFGFKCNWDGKPTTIQYKNTAGQKFDLTEEEARYLPFVPRRYAIAEQDGQKVLISKDFTTEGVEKKIGLAQIIQEKLHDIEGILPRAKSVEAKDIHLLKSNGITPEQFLAEKGFLPKGENLGNGQINIVTGIDNNSDGIIILDLMSHEMQHAADTIKMYRGGESASNEALKRVGVTLEEYNKANAAEFKDLDFDTYVKKVIDKKGELKKGTPEYDEAVDLYEMNYRTTSVKDLTSVTQHDSMLTEQRAIDREKQQIGLLTQINQKVLHFLASLV